MGHALVVFSEQIHTKITVEIAPDGVGVVCLVLGVVIFEHEGGSLDTIVVSFAPFESARPGEVDLTNLGFVDPFQFILSHLGPQPVHVLFDQFMEHFNLADIHIAGGKAQRVQRFRLEAWHANDIARGCRGDDRLVPLLGRE